MDSSNKFRYSIVDLPVELILTICKFLDNKSRLNMSATCKSWKCLTENWLKFTLCLHPSSDYFKHKVMIQTRRQFSNIQIKGNLRGNKLVDINLEFFTQAGTVLLSAVNGMTISRTYIHLSSLNTLLKMFPNLQYLELSSVMLLPMICDEPLSDEDKPIFEQLKKLSFGHGTDNSLLQIFTNAKLTTLICHDQPFTRSTVWQFLSTQSELKEIDFCRIASNATFEFGIDKSTVPFTLNKVVLDYILVIDFAGIKDLFLLQSNNFETVELGLIPDLLNNAVIFSNLKNLKTLHLMPGSVANNLNNELILQPLPSVTNLRLYDGANYGLTQRNTAEMAIKIIENLPNLEDLELFMPYKQIYYHTIVTNLKKLKNLTIRVSFNTNLKNLKFPPVERLRIKYFNYRMCGVAHPSISMVREIQESVKWLIYEGRADSQFYDFIRYSFPKLEVLEVRKDLANCEHARFTDIRQVFYRETNFFTQVMRYTE